MRVTIIDARHYDRKKSTKDMPADVATLIDKEQPPREDNLPIITKMARRFARFLPAVVITSPQPRAYNYGSMIVTQNNWGMDIPPIIKEPAFDDFSSDPLAKTLVPEVKRLAKRYQCEVEEAMLRCKKVRAYL